MEEWASALKEIFGPPENMEKARDPMEYQTPMDTELVAAWVEASGDPETEVPKWLVQGAPLGIELPIHSCGIFPPAEKKEGNSVGEAITQGELEKKGFKNYLSVESNKEDAEAELARYENLGYLRRLPKEEALRDFGGGTISKLGLVVKLKPDQTKKLRIVIDLRRSGGNAKSELPERLVLPRPLDAVQSLREQKRKKVEEGQGDCGAEFALIDISNAFTTLPLHSKELRHSLSPSTKEGEMLQFRALLFGLPAGRPEWTTRDQAVSREEKGPATKSTEEQEEQHSPGLEKERDESSSKRDRKETLHRKGLLQQEWRSPQNFKEEHHQEDPGGSRGLQRRETISGDHEDPGFSLEGGGVQVRAELPHRAEDVAPRRRRLWDSQLDRTFKLCKRGLERGKGPARKAPEVPKERREFTKELLVRATTCKVKFPHLLFVFGMVWMLREIEIAALNTEDIVVDYVGKKVTLVWQFSKKDQEALGMKRTLQCLCGQSCSGECPFWVSTQLVNAVEKFNGANSAIALTRSRAAPNKDMIVKSWTRTFGMPVGGHSARRTGALSYIRAGWDVGQVAYLGRWSSNIILEYAKEALEEVPVNLRTPKMVEGFYPAKRLASEDSLQSLMDTQAKTQMEVKRMKSDFKAVKEKVEDTVEQLEKWAETGDNLPERVQSTHSKVVHANMATLAVSPPFSWRTKCGWHYHFSHYVFVKSNVEVTCAKCKAAQ